MLLTCLVAILVYKNIFLLQDGCRCLSFSSIVAAGALREYTQVYKRKDRKDGVKSVIVKLTRENGFNLTRILLQKNFDWPCSCAFLY